MGKGLGTMGKDKGTAILPLLHRRLTRTLLTPSFSPRCDLITDFFGDTSS